MLYQRFCQQLKKLEISNQPWLIGLSGGVDSTVLLELCHRYREQTGQEVAAAHLNHGLRQTAVEDVEFCRQLCATFNLPFTVEKIDVAGLAKAEDTGLEEAGRLARHRFFARLIKVQTPPPLLLLAHHANDQAETVLHHLLRGAGPRGLGGMADRQFFQFEDNGFAAVRPLLEFTRAELVSYAQSRGLSWREDESNQDPAFLRNRLRHEALPLLENIRPGTGRRLAATARHFRELGDTLAALASDLRETLCQPVPGGYLLYTDSELPPLMLVEIIREVIENDLQLPPFGEAGYTGLKNLLAGETGKVCLLPEGAAVRREKNGLFIFNPLTASTPPLGELWLPEAAPFQAQGLGVRISAEPRPAGQLPDADRANPEIEWLDTEKLQLPLVLRPRQDGDRFQPLGAAGEQKVKDFLIDHKIPQREKEGSLILADTGGVLWLWPWRLAERARITTESRVAWRIHISRL